MARCLAGTLGFEAEASGIIIALTIGRLRWPRTSSSNTLSSAEESDAPGWMIGFRSSIEAAEAVMREPRLVALHPVDVAQEVLISPLCASTRNGWASFHCGKVLVE